MYRACLEGAGKRLDDGAQWIDMVGENDAVGDAVGEGRVVEI